MIEFALESGRGEVIPLVSHSGSEGAYILGDETAGFGFAQATVSFSSGAGIGARISSSRVGKQDAVLHICVWHPDRHERETLLRRLASLVRHRPDQALPRITATYSETGEVCERAFVFQGGGATINDEQGDVSELLLEVTHPHPYWRSRTPLTVHAQIPLSGTLLPEFDKQQVAAAGAFGDYWAINPGDVSVPVQWKIMGPSTGPTTVTVDGRGFTFLDPLGLYEWVEVNVSTGGITVTDHLGRDRFASLGNQPEFPWLPEGGSQIVMKIEGASTASMVSGYAYPEIEVVHG